MSEDKKTGFALPLRIDTQAYIATNEGIVLDRDYKVVACFPTIEEAEEFVAEANGADVETQRRETTREAQARHEYIRNLRQGKKVR